MSYIQFKGKNQIQNMVQKDIISSLGSRSVHSDVINQTISQNLLLIYKFRNYEDHNEHKEEQSEDNGSKYEDLS